MIKDNIWQWGPASAHYSNYSETSQFDRIVRKPWRLSGNHSLAYCLPPVLLTAFFVFTSPHHLILLEVAAGLFLFSCAWSSYLHWKTMGNGALPLFSMVAFMNWVYFGLPLYWEDRDLMTFNHATDEILPFVMLMATLGLCCIWLGIKTVPRIFPLGSHINRLRLKDLTYVRCILITGTIFGLYDGSPYLLGPSGRQLMVIVTSLLPLSAFIVLLHRCLAKRANNIDKLLVAAFLLLRTIGGLAQGWLGTVGTLMIVATATYLTIHRRLKLTVIAPLILCIIFLQVGKGSFRATYWYGGQAGGPLERTQYWIDQSWTAWHNALSAGDVDSMRSLSLHSVSRMSLLQHASNVFDKTPSVVPFQYGRTYYYMAITLIPRFLWTDKPTVNEANQFYQRAYGITAEEDLGDTSIATGYLAESYINFGWAGVVGVTYLIGLTLGIINKLFFSSDTSLLLKAIGIALLPGLLGLESQLAQYLAGLLQQVTTVLLIYLPAVTLRKRSGNRAV